MITQDMQAAVAAEVINDPTNQGYAKMTPDQQVVALSSPYTTSGQSILMAPRISAILNGIPGALNAITGASLSAIMAGTYDSVFFAPAIAQLAQHQIIISDKNSSPAQISHAKLLAGYITNSETSGVIAIQNEINTDPTNQGYAGQTTDQQAVLLNNNYIVPTTIAMPPRLTMILRRFPEAPITVASAEITTAVSAVTASLAAQSISALPATPIQGVSS